MKDPVFSVGTVVQNCAGRNINGLYIIIGKLDYPYVWIADGRKYTLDKPKKKNCRHLRMLETSVSGSDAVSCRISNEWIRSVLNQSRDEMTREVLHV